MKVKVRCGRRAYVVHDERVDSGVLIPGGSRQRMCIKTDSGDEIWGRYGETIFLTKEKAELVLEANKKPQEVKKVNVCGMCGKESPLYSKLCECRWDWR